MKETRRAPQRDDLFLGFTVLEKKVSVKLEIDRFNRNLLVNSLASIVLVAVHRILGEKVIALHPI